MGLFQRAGTLVCSILLFVSTAIINAHAAPAGPGQAPPLPPAAVGWVLGGVYLGYGVVLLIGAVLKLVAGWRNFWSAVHS